MKTAPTPQFLTCAILCALSTLALGDPVVPILKEDNPPLHIVADHIEGANENEAKADGNVIMRQGKLRMDAQWARYNSKQTFVWAGDTTVIEKEGDTLIGKNLEFNTFNYHGKLDDPIYFLRDMAGRGDAVKLLFEGENLYRFKQGRFTTCDLGDDAWYIRGSDIQLNFIDHTGVAKHGVFEFKGVPIMYMPWINFPLDGHRQSGFLAPIFGTDTSRGLNIGLPYYWNIAPNYDATITPQLFTKRGTQLGGEFRYLQPDYTGVINGEFLPNDLETKQNRYSWKILHRQNLGAGFNLSADLQGVSDNRYFTDFSNNIQAASTTNLPRDIMLNYDSESWWYASVRTLKYQTLQSTTNPISAPYARSPQIAFGGKPPLEGPLVLDLWGEFNRFTHSTLTSGNRLIFYPSISMPFETSFGFFRPKVGLHTTGYQINNNTKTIHDNNYKRTLPIANIDTGLIFERDFKLLGKNMMQTLEPRLYYLYTPYRNQSLIPNFDSADIDFNFSQMFSENQFSGGDRINNANQLTAATSSSFYETDSGLERLRVGMGQRFYFQDQKITLNAPARPIDQKHSDTLVFVSSELWQGLGMGASTQYSFKNHQTNKYNLEMAWNPAPAKILNLRYRFDRTNPDGIRQTDISGQWPIAARWYAVGRYNYSIKDKMALESIGGLQYNAGCWGLQFLWQRYVTDGNKMNNSFFVIFDLKDFISIGNGMSILREQIPGYTKTN